MMTFLDPRRSLHHVPMCSHFPFIGASCESFPLIVQIFKPSLDHSSNCNVREMALEHMDWRRRTRLALVDRNKDDQGEHTKTYINVL